MINRITTLLCIVLALTAIACSDDDGTIVDAPKNCGFDPDEVEIQCDAIIPAFYFDRKKNSCVAFEYGGCNDGPYEPFLTIEECELCVCSK